MHLPARLFNPEYDQIEQVGGRKLIIVLFAGSSGFTALNEALARAKSGEYV